MDPSKLAIQNLMPMGNSKHLTAIKLRYGKNLNKAEYRYITETRNIEGVESDFLTECAAELMTPQAVADRLREVFGSNALNPKSSAEKSNSGFNRSIVNSTLIALNAKDREEVVEFRKVVMKNKLITHDKIEGWIRRNLKKDGPPTPPNESDHRVRLCRQQ